MQGNNTMGFPLSRLRRLRRDENMRRMMAETKVSADDFVYPLFVCPGSRVKKEVQSMPGVYQMSVDNIVKECKTIYDLQIPAVLLFGIPEVKDAFGTEAYSEKGIIQKAVNKIKKELP